MGQRFGTLKWRVGMLDYRSYNSYLESEHWREFRVRVLKRSPQCPICRTMASVIHHKTYERLGDEKFEDVVALCPECHNELHRMHRKHKIPLDQFDRVARLVRRSLGYSKKGKRKGRPKPQSDTSPAPVPFMPESLRLYGQRKLLKSLWRTHRKVDWIARTYAFNEADIRAMFNWFKQQDKAKPS